MSHVTRKLVFAICEQHMHPRSLISAFVVRVLDSIIPLVSVSKISNLWLVPVAEQAGLCLTWSQTPKTDFLVTRLIYWKEVRFLSTVHIETLENIHRCALDWFEKHLFRVVALLKKKKNNTCF